MSIEIKIIDKEINDRLNVLSNQLNGQHDSVMSVVAEILHKQTMQTFSNEGDPAGSWAPLAKSTIRDRKAKGYGPKPILKRSELLMRSIHASAGVDYAQLSVGAPQTPALHFGVNIKRQGFIRLRTKNKSGELLRQKAHNNLAVFAGNQHKRAVTRAVSYVINIPARPILPVDENQQLTQSAKTAIFEGVSRLLLKTS